MRLREFIERCIRFNYPNLTPSKKDCFCCKNCKIIEDVPVTDMVRQINDITTSPKANADYFACINCYYLVQSLVKYKSLLSQSAIVSQTEGTTAAGTNVLDRLIVENKKAKAHRKQKRKTTTPTLPLLPSLQKGETFDLSELPKLPNVSVQLVRVRTEQILLAPKIKIRYDENGYTSDICGSSFVGGSGSTIAKRKKHKKSKHGDDNHVSNGYMSDSGVQRVKRARSMPATTSSIRIGRPIKRKLDNDFVYFDTNAIAIESPSLESSDATPPRRQRGRPKKQLVCFDTTNANEIESQTLEESSDLSSSPKRQRGRPRKQSNPKHLPNPHLHPNLIESPKPIPVVQSSLTPLKIVNPEHNLRLMQPKVLLQRVSKELLAKYVNEYQRHNEIVTGTELVTESNFITDDMISKVCDAVGVSETLDEDLITSENIQDIMPNDYDVSLLPNNFMDELLSDLDSEVPVQSTPIKRPRLNSKDLSAPAPFNGNPACMQEVTANFNSLLIHSDNEEESPADESNSSSLLLNGTDDDDDTLSQTETASQQQIDELNSLPTHNGSFGEDDDEEDDDGDGDYANGQDHEDTWRHDSVEVIQLPSQESRSPYRSFTMNSNKRLKSVSFSDRVSIHRYSPDEAIAPINSIIRSEDLYISPPEREEDEDDGIQPQDLDFAVESVFNECDQIEV